MIRRTVHPSTDEIRSIHFRPLRWPTADARVSTYRDASASIERRPDDAIVAVAIVAVARMHWRTHGTISIVVPGGRQPLHANIPAVASIVGIQPMPMRFVPTIVALVLHLPAGTCCLCSRNDNHRWDEADDDGHDDDDHDDGHMGAFFHMVLEPANRSFCSGRGKGWIG